jgi:hypothetical protein
VVGQPWDYTGSEYNVAAYEAATNGGFQTYLLQYTAATYPDAAHPSFVEATLSPNTSTQETINLIVSDFESLEIQPFTHLRGALVEGSDSVRHHANLINMGGEFCFNFLDVIFSDDNEYRHGGGRITINHPKSCMQFRDESRLHVLENATLRYGDEGAGMLVVCASAGITLDRGATLVMDGMLSLSECSDDPTPKSIVVDLPPGARLVFTDKALLTNQFSQFQQTTLTVRMLGGELDDSALSAEERALIHREYPVPKPGFDDNLQVFPNPFTVNPSVQYTTDEDEPLHIQWLNLNGQLIQESVFMAKKGANEWQPAAPAAAGVYLLVVEGKKGKTIRKVAGL